MSLLDVIAEIDQRQIPPVVKQHLVVLYHQTAEQYWKNNQPVYGASPELIAHWKETVDDRVLRSVYRYPLRNE